MRYIALLRGINVGGHVVKMADLRQHFTELGLLNVRSYIQSGNVFFESPEKDIPTLTTRIETSLHQKLGYAVPTFLRTPAALKAVLESAPFSSMTIRENMRACLLFLAHDISLSTFPIASPKGDIEVVAATKREAFVIWHILNGKPPTSQSFLDKTVGTPSTTRFFHTAQKILTAEGKS